MYSSPLGTQYQLSPAPTQTLTPYAILLPTSPLFLPGLASPEQVTPVQSTVFPLEPHTPCLLWVQQGCSQQSCSVTAPQKLQNPVSLSGHLRGHQEGSSSRSASAFKQHGLQLLVNSSISNLEDSLSRSLNTAVTTVRSDLFLNVKDTPPQNKHQ